MSFNVDEEFPFVSNEESITAKDWAAGSREPKEFIECLFEGKEAEFSKITYSPQLQKMFDEPIVNCIDHAVKNQLSANPVKNISVEIDDAGKVIIMNDGDGIPAIIHPKASAAFGKDTYLPTVVFGRLFQGSNRNDNMPVGGTNGIGAKITNCLSETFTLDTVRDGNLFHQEWTNMMKDEGTPKITATKVKEYTKLTFMPKYSHFGYDDNSLVGSMPDIKKILYSRVCLAAIFCKYAVGAVSFKFNGIAVGGINLPAVLYPNAQTFKFATDAPQQWQQRLATKKFPWDVSITIAPHKHQHITNINGIVVRDGRHTSKLTSIISKAVKEKIAKQLSNDMYKLPANFVKNNVFYVINTQMIKPEWTGQRKDVLDTGLEKMTSLIIPDKILGQIVRTLADMALLDKEPATKDVKESSKAIDYDKYVKAKKYGAKTSLMACEGDSAMNQLKNGLSSGMGFDYYGLISLGGVIVNAMKETTEFDLGDDAVIRKTGKFENNKFMKAFVKIVGLKYDYKYDKDSDTYAKEMSTLKYGAGIIIAVDQDMDGRGNIMPLLMALFKVFWPNLLKNGFVKWFCTDVVKLFPKKGGKVISFMSEYKFREACREIDTTKYNIKFYKGMATNTPDEIKAMFRNFNSRIKTITTDDATDDLFEIYYGKFAALRKKKLSSVAPVIPDSIIAKQEETGIISASIHLDTETYAFQMNNLEQKLDHMIDGQNQSSRKILNGAILYFNKNNNSAVRVSQLGGNISETQSYHHGEASLYSSIKRRAFIAVGGVQLPMFMPLGSFGTRLEGGSDAGSERYISTCLTDIVPIIFNEADYELLEFNFEDNRRIEPKYFMPIVPLVILESKELPAHGWKISLWARDVFGVIGAIRAMIRGQRFATLQPSRHGWKGKLGVVRGKPHSFGEYERYNLAGGKHLIRITELPLRVWTDVYMRNTLNKMLLKYDFIESVESNNNTETVGIDITLANNGLDKIAGCGDGVYTDDIEEFFQLRNSMNSHINLIGLHGEVAEFTTYEAVLKEWFPVRKEHYAKRIERQIVLLDIDITIRESIIKYIVANYKLRGMKRQEMDIFLKDNGYFTVNPDYLKDIKFAPTAELKKIAFDNTNANYIYLLSINDLSRTEESIDKKQIKLDTLILKRKALLDEIATDAFIGASAWLRELDLLEYTINEGHRTEWLFKNKDMFTY